jgi:hypothetical protein
MTTAKNQMLFLILRYSFLEGGSDILQLAIFNGLQGWGMPISEVVKRLTNARGSVATLSLTLDLRI